MQNISTPSISFRFVNDNTERLQSFDWRGDTGRLEVAMATFLHLIRDRSAPRANKPPTTAQWLNYSAATRATDTRTSVRNRYRIRSRQTLSYVKRQERKIRKKRLKEHENEKLHFFFFSHSGHVLRSGGDRANGSRDASLRRHSFKFFFVSFFYLHVLSLCFRRTSWLTFVQWHKKPDLDTDTHTRIHIQDKGAASRKCDWIKCRGRGSQVRRRADRCVKK